MNNNTNNNKYYFIANGNRCEFSNPRNLAPGSVVTGGFPQWRHFEIFNNTWHVRSESAIGKALTGSWEC